LPRAVGLLNAFGGEVADVGRLLLATARTSLRIDVPIAVLAAVYLALFAPLLPRNADNPELLAAYSNDEPFLTMALEATLVPPYGNPGAYFDPENHASAEIPAHWGEKRYTNISYYGGTMYLFAAPPYALLRAVGAPPFPTGPIVLRAVTLLAGLLALIVLYNIGRQRGSRVAAMFAAVFVATDGFFVYYANYTHPDSLQLLFALCAFVFAALHARTGTRASLIALGLFCGVVQGTKAGGIWTIPMALLALWLGTRADAAPLRRRLRAAAGRLLVLGGAALVGFFVTTPYAFFDTYYSRSIALTYRVVADNHLQLAEAVSLLTWTETLYDYLGPVATTLLALTVVRTIWVNRRGIADPDPVLALTLGAALFLWYGTSVEVWHIIGYLVVGYALLSVFAFETLFAGVRRGVELARRLPRHGVGVQRVAWVAIVAAAAVVLAGERWLVPASWAVTQYSLSHDTVRTANEWALAHDVPGDATIVNDDLAYFDPERFPNARLHGGVLTWNAIEILKPQYVVLSQSLWGAAWMQELIETQKETRKDPDAFNVRLYQDLLPTTRPGPTRVPGFELAGVIRATGAETIARQQSRIEGAGNACDGPLVCNLGVIDLKPHLYAAAGLERRIRALALDGREPLTGPEIRIYRVTDPGAVSAALSSRR
jgi:hypothetical protein